MSISAINDVTLSMVRCIDGWVAGRVVNVGVVVSRVMVAALSCRAFLISTVLPTESDLTSILHVPRECRRLAARSESE
jgi:hypothetical protein